MIKNDSQAKRTAAKLQDIFNEIKQLESQYSGIELEFWASQFRDEAVNLQKVINDYQLLTVLSLEDAIEGPLQEPILLENIGQLLTKLRIAAKLSQEEMAKKLGWQQSNLSRFESENYSSQTIGKISEYIDALGIWLYVIPKMTEKPPENIFKTVQPRTEIIYRHISNSKTLETEKTTTSKPETISSRYEYQKESIETGLAESLFRCSVSSDKDADFNSLTGGGEKA